MDYSTAILYFTNQINGVIDNEYFMKNKKNMHHVEIWTMCINRISQRYLKQLRNEK